MPAKLRMLEGAQAGWEFVITGKSARIGSDANDAIRLTELPVNGGLEIAQRISGYEVTNQLPHAIYVDGKTLPPLESHTLHDGMLIQASSSVLFRVTLVGAVNGSPRNGVVSIAPPKAKGSSQRWLPIALALVCAIGVLMMRQNQQAAAAREQQLSAQAVECKAMLRTIRESELSRFGYPAFTAFTDGLYLESIGEPRKAIDRFQEAMQLIDLMKVDPQLAPHHPALQTVSQFLRTKLTMG